MLQKCKLLPEDIANKIINELEVMNNKIKNKYTSDLFNSLKIDSSVINNDQLNSLNEKGYVIFPPNKIMTENLKTLNDISDQLIYKKVIKVAGKVNNNIINQERNLNMVQTG